MSILVPIANILGIFLGVALMGIGGYLTIQAMKALFGGFVPIYIITFVFFGFIVAVTGTLIAFVCGYHLFW